MSLMGIVIDASAPAATFARSGAAAGMIATAAAS
jgi:hypothetical protein